ncbi:MAG: tyrosine-type recombinase/integrase [Bacteroidales bacterium]|nr:tyrosine-type recombinase/integrase [Bacteroidales bacterium]MCF8343637.1 tyrosine-type recombinase/integrase [Bacteroidales bacterium]MCF8375183.1 tyrosine-type recombinase/integrase [Bacteroidales bacterium]MCF8400695.1 tyrosine-type recombinase/integrase [Bacteroidales bacterium]
MAVTKFIQYITYEKRYSPHTIGAYRTDLEQFIEYTRECFGIIDPGDITHQIIRSWIVSLIENGVSNRSANRKISSVKAYFSFLLKEGHISKNPFGKIIRPKSGTRLPVYVEQEQIERLLAQIEDDHDHASLRDKLIIELFYVTGMRLSELINIRESDIDFYTLYIKVLGKRNKERLIPFNNQLADRIKSYMELKNKEFKEAGTWLFVTDKGKKLYPKLIYRIVTAYLSVVTSLKKKSPHVLRHTFATHMLNQGADLNAIKEILGHANLTATQVYTHNSIGQLKSIHHKSHPREKSKGGETCK